MLKALVRQADTVLLMVRGTMNGLSRLRPFSRMVSAVAHGFRGGAARTDDQPGARVRDLVFAQAGVIDGLLHGDGGVGRGIAHEAQVLLVDVRAHVHPGETADLGAQPHLPVGCMETDARTGLAEGGQHRRDAVAQR